MESEQEKGLKEMTGAEILAMWEQGSAQIEATPHIVEAAKADVKVDGAVVALRDDYLDALRNNYRE